MTTEFEVKTKRTGRGLLGAIGAVFLGPVGLVGGLALGTGTETTIKARHAKPSRFAPPTLKASGAKLGAALSQLSKDHAARLAEMEYARNPNSPRNIARRRAAIKGA